MNSMDELIDSLIIELKRGTLVLSVLSQLHSAEYGYSLVQKLEEKNVPIEAGTLYPLLRRLEKQNLLISEWDTSESRPRKFYILSEEGKEVYARLKNEWKFISKQLEILLKEDDNNEPD
ncbi:transcriptional regulator, PadR family [Clostridium amylolyticum]|uniref:Transcriptional regulator, PadR family n=1 Tax=Clostridium amylolyticum TaxID=1121298 RepID=A0A1M6H6I5_9CLOT|nr:PadR family transcriptional regulator [Clostridium amylolyticum]SHJ17815.1 transcriptional regulator, PadR family [Clostridium amylolyticum]